MFRSIVLFPKQLLQISWTEGYKTILLGQRSVATLAAASFLESKISPISGYHSGRTNLEPSSNTSYTCQCDQERHTQAAAVFVSMRPKQTHTRDVSRYACGWANWIKHVSCNFIYPHLLLWYVPKHLHLKMLIKRCFEGILDEKLVKHTMFFLSLAQPRLSRQL